MILAPSDTVLTRVQAGQLVDNVPFGTWNGTATAASLVNNYGSTPNAARGVNIWRTDWQGNQLLYPTPRTNQLLTSILGTDWNLQNGSLTSGQSSPDGGTNAVLYLDNSTNGPHNFYPYPRLVTPVIGQPYVFSQVIKNGGNNYAMLAFDNSGEVQSKGYDLTTGLATSYVPATSPNFNYLGEGIISLGNGWWWIWLCASANFDNTTLNPAIWQAPTIADLGGPYAGTGTGVVAFQAQLEIGTFPTSFINVPAGTGPVTLTDYTLTGTTVNLAQAPASTAITDATYYAT